MKNIKNMKIVREYNKIKKILVIGGSGFLGNNICRYLVKKGYEVFNFDLIKVGDYSDITFIKGDFFNEQDLKEAVMGKDCVIHAVSTLNPGNSNEAYMQGYQKDFIQTIRLCHILSQNNTRLLFLSSGGTVYGNQSYEAVDENVLPHPINHYGNVKLSIENTMRTFNYQMGTDFLIARISNPYGYGQNFHKGVGFIDAVLKNAISEMPIEIWGDGYNIRDYIYVDDVCEMIECIINYSGEYDTFNVSSGRGVSQNDIIDIVKSIGYSPKVEYKEKRKVDVKSIVLNNNRIEKIWKKIPTKVECGIKLYSDYLKQNVMGDKRI